MKRLGVTLALAIAAFSLAIPAVAKDFVQDGAGMFSAGTLAQLNSRIGTFNAQTGKEIVVVTVPSLNGQTLQQAAGAAFSQQNVNGVLIFISKDDRRDIIVPGRATAQFFPAETTQSIRQSMESQFKGGDFDGGITTAVSGTLDVFRAHMNALPGSSNRVPATYNNYPASGGFHLSMFWWIVIIVVGFLVLRSIMRSMSGPRYYGGPGPGGAPMGGPGYGGYGGPSYYGGGGGGFWSGLLGGLGGAWLGNEMFGNRGGGGGGGYLPGAGDSGGGWGGGNADSGGWGSDAGQADFGSSSSGDFSGGGFGGGDGGGGGGGGDSGGGW